MCNNCRDRQDRLKDAVDEIEEQDSSGPASRNPLMLLRFFNGYRSALVVGSSIAIALHSGNWLMAWAFMLQASLMIGAWRISPIPEFIRFMDVDIALGMTLLMMALKYVSFCGLIPVSVWSMVALEASFLIIIGGYITKLLIRMKDEIATLRNPEKAKKEKEEILEILNKTQEIIGMIEKVEKSKKRS